MERESPVHRQRARVKILLALVSILCISLTPTAAWPAYILYFSITLSVASLSKLEYGTLLKRALVALPFGLAALPLIFSSPDHTLLLGMSVIPYNLDGWLRFLSILIKIWLSMQVAIILNATTSFNQLLDGLAELRLPAIFISIFSLMWRYLFVIVQEAQRLMQARASRSVRLPDAPRGSHPLLWQMKVTGQMAGSIFLRSLERSDRVYLAMKARGYNGQQPIRKTEPLQAEEKMTLMGGILLCFLILFLGLLTGRAV